MLREQSLPPSRTVSPGQPVTRTPSWVSSLDSRVIGPHTPPCLPSPRTSHGNPNPARTDAGNGISRSNTLDLTGRGLKLKVKKAQFCSPSLLPKWRGSFQPPVRPVKAHAHGPGTCLCQRVPKTLDPRSSRPVAGWKCRCLGPGLRVALALLQDTGTLVWNPFPISQFLAKVHPVSRASFMQKPQSVHVTRTKPPSRISGFKLKHHQFPPWRAPHRTRGWPHARQHPARAARAGALHTQTLKVWDQHMFPGLHVPSRPPILTTNSRVRRRGRHAAMPQQTENRTILGVVPDPGGQRRCEHKSSSQRPRLSHFCRMNFMEEGTLVSELRFRLV